MLQPEGGFYPLVLMQPWAKKVKLVMSKQISSDDINKLSKLFSTKLEPALATYNADLKENGLCIYLRKKLNLWK